MMFILGFIVGILSYIIVFPICEQFTSYVLQYIERAKGYITYDINVINNDIDKIGYVGGTASAIGFEIPPDEVIEVDDDDEGVDENVYCDNKLTQMGFH